MRLISFGAAGAERPGLLDDDDQIVPLDPMFDRLGAPSLPMNAVVGMLDHLRDELTREIRQSAHRLPMNAVRVGPPIPHPRNILGLGMNYSPGTQGPQPTPADYTSASPIFSKPQASLAGWRDDILLPPETTMLDYEVELAIVIGRYGRRIAARDASEHIAGYMLVNDLTARDIMFGTTDLSLQPTQPALKSQFLVGKGYETFLPCGPWVVTADAVDAKDVELWLTVNQQPRQRGQVNDMLLDCHQVVELMSRFATLHPGDLILTGTPPGSAVSTDPAWFLTSGDVVDASAQPGLGMLRNEVHGPPTQPPALTCRSHAT